MTKRVQLDILGSTKQVGPAVLILSDEDLAANTALDGVLLGTPVTPAIPSNTVILSSLAIGADFLLAGNRGGNSEALLWYDASAGVTHLYSAGAALQVHADLNLQSNSLTNIGNSGSQLLPDAWTMTGAADQLLSIATTGAGGLSILEALLPESGTGIAQIRFRQGNGSGSTNNMQYEFTLEGAASYFRFRSQNIDGSGNSGNIFLVNDGTDDVQFFGGISTDGEAVPTAGIRTAGPFLSAFPNTVAGTGLMVTTSNTSVQEVMRDSSSIAFKSDWVDITLEEARRVLDVRAGHYTMGGQEDAGFYVEDFEQAGITDILAYTDGKPTAFKTFGRGITAYLQPVVRDHEERLKELEAQARG